MATMRRRDIGADIRWGIREGLILTAIVFVPAMLVVIFRQEESWLQFLQVLAAYLLFGAGGGALLGLLRPSLARRLGATLVGSLIGAVGLVALVCTPSGDRPFPGMVVALISAMLGIIAGALLGWWAWQLNARGQRR